MSFGLFYLLFLIVLGYLIYRVTKKVWKSADIEERMDEIKTTKNISNEINNFTNKHGRKDFNRNINKFAKGD